VSVRVFWQMETPFPLRPALPPPFPGSPPVAKNLFLVSFPRVLRGSQSPQLKLLSLFSRLWTFVLHFDAPRTIIRDTSSPHKYLRDSKDLVFDLKLSSLLFLPGVFSPPLTCNPDRTFTDSRTANWMTLFPASGSDPFFGSSLYKGASVPGQKL